MKKPKIALTWCSSCGGCEESVIDSGEFLLELGTKAEIVFWPIALDHKFEDIAGLGDGALTAALINGAIRMDQQEDMAKWLRRKSRWIIAHGSCAHLGGVYGLANFHDSEDILGRCYQDASTVKNPKGRRPQRKVIDGDRELTLSGFRETVKSLDQVVDVDYYLPGCPPPPALVEETLRSVLEGTLPKKGTVLAEKRALCESCERRDTLPKGLRINRFKRLYEKSWDPGVCFLAQDLICLGPATRGGCEGRCIQANIPCRGCFGPLDRIADHGAKVLSFLASLIDAEDEDTIKEIVHSIPDPAGLIYRYTLPSSILKKGSRSATLYLSSDL
jgi:F420-non-reducing hydrogenase small subunit